MRLNTLWLGLAASLLGGASVAPESAAEGKEPQIAAIFDGVSTDKSPGLSVLVKKDGKVIFKRAYGLRRLKTGARIRTTTNFRLASVTKQFTAMAVMMLVEEGKIGLDEQVSKYIPESPAIWKDVTIRNLLTHTSGIADYGGEEDLMEKGVINFRKDYTEEELTAVDVAYVWKKPDT